MDGHVSTAFDRRYKELVAEDALHVIVIGQTTCSHCIAVKPVLSRVAGNNNIEIKNEENEFLVKINMKK